MSQHLKDSTVYVGILKHLSIVSPVGLILQPKEKEMGGQRAEMWSELSQEEFRDRGRRKNSKDRGLTWREYLLLPPGFIG